MATGPHPTRLVLSCLALASLALAGCAQPASPSASGVPTSDAATFLMRAGNLQRSGSESASRVCPGVGDLTYTVQGRGGTIQVQVTDQETGTVVDTGPLEGDQQNTVHGLLGGHDRWTLSVGLSGFTGDYNVVLACGS
jgi:predicted dehydrogenase